MLLTKRPTEVSIFSSTGSLVEAAFGRDAPVIAIVLKGGKAVILQGDIDGLRRAHCSGIPALRRPSYVRSLISTQRGSLPWDIWSAFHAAIVLTGPVEGSAR
jgi:hypothetical protein